MFYSQNDLYPLSLIISFFCFHGFFVSFPTFNGSNKAVQTQPWGFIDFPEDLRVQRGLIGRYHPNYLAIGWARRAKKRSLCNGIFKTKKPKVDPFVWNIGNGHPIFNDGNPYNALRIRLYVLRIRDFSLKSFSGDGFRLSYPMTWEWDWYHQRYFREGSGFWRNPLKWSMDRHRLIGSILGSMFFC